MTRLPFVLHDLVGELLKLNAGGGPTITIALDGATYDAAAAEIANHLGVQRNGMRYTQFAGVTLVRTEPEHEAARGG